ncbi:hypothetical protein N0V90_008394 [Kalmusia sp. IMI 367209]|nr:hypothetical protein N0V90_008394 [Kalmusia sp. IMI 367209]
MKNIARSLIVALAAAVLSQWGYGRYLALSDVFKNRSGHLTPVYNIKSHEIAFSDRIRNCEDLLLDEGLGVAILSCDPGRDHWNTVMGTFRADKNLKSGKLWLYDYSHPDLEEEQLIKPLKFEDFPNENDFHPLGLELDQETSTLYVVNHAQSGSAIEVFQLSIREATLTYVKTYKHRLIQAPNALHSIGNGRLYVTNDHMLRAAISPLLSKIETFSGLPGGSVVYTDLNDPNTTTLVARLAFANGIAMLNANTLAVSSTSGAGVYFYEVQPDHSLQFKSWVRTPAAIDNLSVDSNGVLLVAGHPSALDLMKVSKNRPYCKPESDIQAEREACGCSAPSYVAQWTENYGLETLYQGYEFCSSTMMVRDVTRGVAFVSGLYEKGVMFVRE